MPRVLLVDAGTLSLSEAAAIPLFVAPRFPEGYGAVVATGRISGPGVTVGSLAAVWSHSVVRRASGGGEYRAIGGDYYGVIVFSGGTLKWAYTVALEEFSRYSGIVYGVGKSASRPFIELYSPSSLEAVVEEAFREWDIVEDEEPIPRELLEPIVSKLSREEWIDPVRGRGSLVSYRVARDRSVLGLVGYVGDGLIRGLWPDSNIPVYPPGLARSLVKEAVYSPPSPGLAYSLANSFISLLEYAGVEPEDIFAVAEGFVRKAEEYAQP